MPNYQYPQYQQNNSNRLPPWFESHGFGNQGVGARLGPDGKPMQYGRLGGVSGGAVQPSTNQTGPPDSYPPPTGGMMQGQIVGGGQSNAWDRPAGYSWQQGAGGPSLMADPSSGGAMRAYGRRRYPRIPRPMMQQPVDGGYGGQPRYPRVNF